MVGSFLLGREWKEDSKARLVIYNNTGHSIRTACWLVAVWHTKEVTWTQRCYDTSRRGGKKNRSSLLRLGCEISISCGKLYTTTTTYKCLLCFIIVIVRDGVSSIPSPPSSDERLVYFGRVIVHPGKQLAT